MSLDGKSISSSRTCDGQSAYKATALNEAAENQVKLLLEAVPKERLVELASARNEETYKVAYKQAQKDFENTQKQVTALEEEAVKALTGESQLDLSIPSSAATPPQEETEMNSQRRRLNTMNGSKKRMQDYANCRQSAKNILLGADQSLYSQKACSRSPSCWNNGMISCGTSWC